MDTGSLKPLFEPLDRYAGWLDRERTSVQVRARVQAIGVAIDALDDPTSMIEMLDGDLARLPGGEVRKMLRKASAALRRAVVIQRGEPSGTLGSRLGPSPSR